MPLCVTGCCINRSCNVTQDCVYMVVVECPLTVLLNMVLLSVCVYGCEEWTGVVFYCSIVLVLLHSFVFLLLSLSISLSLSLSGVGLEISVMMIHYIIWSQWLVTLSERKWVHIMTSLHRETQYASSIIIWQARESL